MLIEKLHYDSTRTPLGSYKPVVPAIGPYLNWPSAPTAQDRKFTSYEPKEDWKDLIRDHQNATTNRTVNGKYFKPVKEFQCIAFGTNNVALPALEFGMKGLPWHNSMPVGLAPTYTHLPVNKDNARAWAASKFLSRIHYQSSNMSAGVTIGELGETLRMLRSPYQALRNAYQSYFEAVEYKALGAKIRGINQKKKRKVINDIVAETWLETQFGVIPLMNDIADIIQTVRDIALRDEVTQVSSKHEVLEEGASTTRIVRMNDIDLQYHFTKKTVLTYYSKCGLLPRVTDLHTAFGLKGYDFVPTMWNLIPYSFIADYFLNINQLLNAMLVVEDDISYSSVSEVTETVNQLTVRVAGGYNPFIKKFMIDRERTWEGIYQWGLKDVVRSDQIPSLRLSYKRPNIRQLANISALIQSSQSTSYKLRGL